MSTLYIKPRRRGVGLTSLVDVVFILLLFFMLTSSFTRQQQLSLDVPVASNLADLGPPQRVGLTQNADLQRWGSPELLSDKALVETFDLNKPLLMSAGEQVQIQTIVSVLMHLDKLGFTQVSIGPVWVREAR